MTAEICATPEEGEFLVSGKHPQQMIGGVLFVHGARDQVALGNIGSTDLYRVFHQKRCFELSVNQSYSNAANYDPPIKTPTPA